MDRGEVGGHWIINHSCQKEFLGLWTAVTVAVHSAVCLRPALHLALQPPVTFRHGEGKDTANKGRNCRGLAAVINRGHPVRQPQANQCQPLLEDGHLSGIQKSEAKLV